MQIYDQAPMSSRLSINVAPQAPAPRVISPLCDYSPRDSDFTTSSFTSTPYRSNIVVALDRVASIFRSTSPISETKFIIACKKIITLLRSPDSRDITPSQQVMLIDVVENAVITFVVRLFPSVIDTITASTSLNLPVSPMIMISLLKVVDAHIIESGDFSTQLRVAAIRQLLDDNEQVSMMLSLCYSPNSTPQIPFTSDSPNQLFNPFQSLTPFDSQFNVRTSPPHLDFQTDLPASSSLASSSFGSPAPSLSSLLNFTPSSSLSTTSFRSFDVNYSNTIHESVSEPRMTWANPIIPNLTQSLSTPDVCLPSMMDHAFGSSNGNSGHLSILRTLSHEDIYGMISRPFVNKSPPLSSSLGHGSEDEEPYMAPGLGPSSSIPGIHLHPPAVEYSPSSQSRETPPYPGPISLVSQDDLSRIISQPLVDDHPSSPSLFSPETDTHSPLLMATLDLAIPVNALRFIDRTTTPGPLQDSQNNSPSSLLDRSCLQSQFSSPLSSPPSIMDTEISEASPAIPKYNGRLRSASNTHPPASPLKNKQRATSVMIPKSKMPPDMSNLSLPPPPKRKRDANDDQDDLTPVAYRRRMRRTKKPRIVSDASGTRLGPGTPTTSRGKVRKRAASVNMVSVDKEN